MAYGNLYTLSFCVFLKMFLIKPFFMFKKKKNPACVAPGKPLLWVCTSIKWGWRLSHFADEETEPRRGDLDAHVLWPAREESVRDSQPSLL